MAEGGKAEMNDSFTLRLKDAPTELQLKDLYKYVLDEKNGGNGCNVAIDVLLHIEDKSVADKLVGVEHTISDKKVTLNHFESRKDEGMDMSGKIILSGVKGIDLHCILLHFTSRDYSGDGSTPQYERVSDDEVILQFKDPKFASSLVGKDHNIQNVEDKRKQSVKARSPEVFERVIAIRKPGRKYKVDAAQFGVRIKDKEIHGSFEQIQDVHRYLRSNIVKSASAEGARMLREKEIEGNQAPGHKPPQAEVLGTDSNNRPIASPTNRVEEQPRQQQQPPHQQQTPQQPHQQQPPQQQPHQQQPPQQQHQSPQQQRQQQQSSETEQAEELNELSARVVFYTLRLHEKDGKFGDFKVKWTDKNESVTVFMEKKFCLDFMKAYEYHKKIIVSSKLNVEKVCKHKVKRIVDRYHSLHTDLSILQQGIQLVFLGTQDVIDRDLAPAEGELMSGDCNPTCRCKNPNSHTISSSTTAAGSSPLSTSRIVDSNSSQSSTGVASASSDSGQSPSMMYKLRSHPHELKLLVYKQDLLNTNVDAILCFTNGSLDGGRVMESLLKRNTGLRAAIDKQTIKKHFGLSSTEKKSEKEIVHFRLKDVPRYVVCMVATSIRNGNVLGDYAEGLLRYADNMKIGSVALPLLGTGRAGRGSYLTEEDAARDIFHAIKSSDLNYLREIHLVSPWDQTVTNITGALDSAMHQLPRGH